MNREQINGISAVLDRMYSQHMFDNAFIVCFGANKPAEMAVNYLGNHGIAVDAIVDNNPAAWGQRKFGVKISSPEKLLGEYKSNAVILIASRYYDDMCLQLSAMGYEQGVHIFQTASFTDYSIEQDKAEEYCVSARRGLELYRGLLNEYGRDVRVLISPCSGLGDIYMIGRYLNGWLTRSGTDNYVLVITGGGSRKVAALYGIEDNTIVMKQQQIDDLVVLSDLLGSAVHIEVLLHCYRHADILSCFELIKSSVNWGDLYRYALFGLDDDVSLAYPEWNVNERGVSERLEKMGAKKGKSVLMAPYAVSLTSVSDYVWEELAARLAQRGYTVFTNCFNQSEVPIEGTEPVSFDIAETKAVLDYMGAFVGLRSGICDIISGLSCRKVIIYPDELSRNFYSLNGMGLCGDAVELAWINADITEGQPELRIHGDYAASGAPVEQKLVEMCLDALTG